MAVTTNKVLRLTFTTAGGKTFAITIPDPREDVDQVYGHDHSEECIPYAQRRADWKARY